MSMRGVISLISRIRENANRFIVREMGQRGMEGLATSHGDILLALFRQSSLSMSELARIINREKPTVTVLVDKLAALGYVQRTRDREDNRVTMVSLTPRGRALQSAFAAISDLLLEKVYQGFTEEEKEVLISLLERISRNL